MNKLFIIGNGFDLAHKYPTSYSHFVKWIWKNIQTDFRNSKFKSLLEINEQYELAVKQIENIYCYNDFIKSITNYSLDYGKFSMSYNELAGYINGKVLYTFKNKLFFKLCISYPDANWSDVESLFYKTLIEVLESKNKIGINIDSLNSDMEEIKRLFTEYLTANVIYNQVNQRMPFANLLKYEPKYLYKYSNNDTSINYFNEFSSDLHSQLIEFDNELIKADENKKWSDTSIEPKTLILDFNYTDTIANYINSLSINYYLYGNITHLQIHGKLNDLKNPINLGFGDEMDDYYKMLETKNDNRYLKYIKSFMYSNNSYYRKLLNWIDTNEFQVSILGHSCGLSDRIMLNTIFEHNNCKSIKVYYYEWNDMNELKDDFTDKIQNISRHFNKKKQMRDKIVDKSLSQPLKV